MELFAFFRWRAADTERCVKFLLCDLHDFVTSLVTIAWQAADMLPARKSLCCILHDFVTSLVTIAWQAADARRPTRHLSCVLHDFVTKCVQLRGRLRTTAVDRVNCIVFYMTSLHNVFSLAGCGHGALRVHCVVFFYVTSLHHW